MTSCEAIVYSKTLTEDFHLITVPRSFSSEDIKWIRSRIDECMVNFVDKRSRKPIFEIFENEKYYIVGVTVTAQDLKDCSLEDIGISDEQTKDVQGRPIYGFFAYVLEKNRGKINNRSTHNSLRACLRSLG
ncbi:hypothetical protein V2H45_22495 [Tumidithrix elongata RA019]|uniref:Uncharacterized protein n=1 Tax=Tumidithrix elongata BACA0141 TaxID=2716417 RepID=A0AAW9Q956_9CYAN|nr:hypothetical protein [Tumidithrix elongata RA019]